MDRNEIVNLIYAQMKTLSENPLAEPAMVEISQDISFPDNQILVFLKPEISESEQAWNLVLEKIEQFGYAVSHLGVLSGAVMKQRQIPGRHYGVINTVSSAGYSALSGEAKAKFKDIWGIEPEQAPILGSLEAIASGKLNAGEISALWSGADPQKYGTAEGIVKLSGGTYCLKTRYRDETLYILNGFHPEQIAHFTSSPEKRVVVFLIRGKENAAGWRQMRREFLGNTDPAKSVPESIRGILYRRSAKMGITCPINMSNNGVHGSAGPIEAVKETGIWLNLPFTETVLGKELLHQGYGQEQIKRILENPHIQKDGQSVPLYDLTEETDTKECLELLLRFYPPVSC